MKTLNLNNVVTAEVKPPYENSKEGWDHYPSHGWQIQYTLTGIYPDGSRITESEDCESEEQAKDVLRSLGFRVITTVEQ
jgi:hypothetical protein